MTGRPIYSSDVHYTVTRNSPKTCEEGTGTAERNVDILANSLPAGEGGKKMGTPEEEDAAAHRNDLWCELKGTRPRRAPN